MSANADETSKPLQRRQMRAARLQAEGALTVAAIAETVGVTVETYQRWNRALPEYRAQVAKVNVELDESAFRSGLTRRRTRIDKLTGLVARLEKRMDRDEYAPPALYRVYLQALQQVAEECGQWTQRVDLSVEGRVEQVRTTEVLIRLNVGADEELARKAQAYRDGTPEPPEAVTEADWRPVERLALVPGDIDQRGPVDEDAPVDSGAERARLERENAERIRQAQEGRQIEEMQRNYR